MQYRNIYEHVRNILNIVTNYDACRIVILNIFLNVISDNLRLQIQPIVGSSVELLRFIEQRIESNSHRIPLT